MEWNKTIEFMIQKKIIKNPLSYFKTIRIVQMTQILSAILCLWKPLFLLYITYIQINPSSQAHHFVMRFISISFLFFVVLMA